MKEHFIFYTEAIQSAFGAVLAQIQNGMGRVFATFPNFSAEPKVLFRPQI